MEIFRLAGKIVVANDEANRKIEETKTKAEGLSGAFSKIGEMTIKASTMLTKGVGVVGAAWAASVEGSREYRTEMGKLNAAFTASGHTTEAAAAAYKTLYGVIGQTDQAVEAAQQIALLADSEKDAAEWAGLAAGVVGRFGDALQPETFFEAANETIKLGEATGAYVQMLEGMGMSVDGFNAGLASCSTEAEKQAYMLGVTRAALGEASKAYNENNKDIIDANKAQSDLTDTMAKIGEYTEPALTKLKEAVTDMAETALPYLKSFMEWTQEHGEATKAAIMGIATAMAIAAAAAHPYAAAVTAIVAALAYMRKQNADGDAYNHFFDQYSDEDLAVLQRWVDTVNEAKRAEEALYNDMNNQSLADAYAAAQEKMQDAHKDANAIDGLIAAYNAWRTGQAENAGGDIYLDVPLRVSDDSENNVQSEIDGMTLDGIVKLLPDTSSIDAALSYTRYMDVYMNPTGAAQSADGSHASGLFSVPHDGYLARLHKKEAVLNEAEADVWRSGRSGRVEALLSELVSVMRAGQVIQLDSGIMAGQLTPAIDAQLGTVAKYKGRGN